MVKIYKPGKVAVIVAGRQAGHKCVVVQQRDEGTKERPYPHAIVMGVERAPLKVTKSMGKKRIAKVSRELRSSTSTSKAKNSRGLRH
jgi:large subunit ribosomal protein L27e